MNSPLWVLGTKLRASIRAVHTLNTEPHLQSPHDGNFDELFSKRILSGTESFPVSRTAQIFINEILPSNVLFDFPLDCCYFLSSSSFPSSLLGDLHDCRSFSILYKKDSLYLWDTGSWDHLCALSTAVGTKEIRKRKKKSLSLFNEELKKKLLSKEKSASKTWAVINHKWLQASRGETDFFAFLASLGLAPACFPALRTVERAVAGRKAVNG